MSRQVQYIICKCGSAIAGCTAPECYEEADWMRDVRKYAKKGYTVETTSVSRPLARCRCKELEAEKKRAVEPELFPA